MSRTKKHQPQYQHSSLFRQQPYADQAESLLASANDLVKIKQFESAYKMVVSLLKIDPGNPDALYLQGDLLKRSGHTAKALECLTAASYQMPNNIKLFGYLADVHWQLGNNEAAVSALHKVIELEPKLGKSRITLGALYHSLGMHERGQYWARQGARLEPITFGKKIDEKKLKLLVLRSSESADWQLDKKSFSPRLKEGHNNLSSLLDTSAIEVVNFYVDYIDESPEVIRKLPKVDLIYNAMTDADRCAAALRKTKLLCEKLDTPVVNLPGAVLKTTREENYQRFKDNQDVILPKSVKYESMQGRAKEIVEEAISKEGFGFPVIIRLGGFQTGRYMHKVDDLETHDFSELDIELAQKPQTVYVIQYYEFGYHDENMPDDMLYLKYRAFLIGKKLYPAHLRGDINQYKVHINDQIFERCPWLEAFEDHFLRDPESYFGRDQWQALEKALCDTGLDYIGVDFAVAKDSENIGKILIFEANASMRNWPTLRNDTPYVYGAWQNNVRAVHEYFCERAGVAPWEFSLPQIEKSKQIPNEEGNAAKAITLRLLITGSVQGVGYRRWFVKQLEQRNISGWVRNLADGSVEAVVHGEQEELQSLCDEVPKGPKDSEVTGLSADVWGGEVPSGVKILDDLN